ncbi:MAG: hypothetical protein PHI98_08750 [Eubacteriales bacterium]|nr:hypothetical protein [Eubacteriales bacterium]
MLLQWIWFAMMGASLLYACISGKGGLMLAAALNGAMSALTLSFRLCAGYLLFCGLIEILKACNVQQWMSKTLKPLLRRVMPGLPSEEVFEAVSLNLTANLLGLGNAATPMGIEAIRLMEREERQFPQVRHAMYLFLIMNATSIQLLPTTVLGLRVAAGSAIPNAILLPSIACTCLSTVVGLGLGLAWKKLREGKHA